MKVLQLPARGQQLEDRGPATEGPWRWGVGVGLRFLRHGLNLSSWEKTIQRGRRKPGEGGQLGDKARESFNKE